MHTTFQSYIFIGYCLCRSIIDQQYINLDMQNGILAFLKGLKKNTLTVHIKNCLKYNPL